MSDKFFNVGPLTFTEKEAKVFEETNLRILVKNDVINGLFFLFENWTDFVECHEKLELQTPYLECSKEKRWLFTQCNFSYITGVPTFVEISIFDLNDPSIKGLAYTKLENKSLVHANPHRENQTEQRKGEYKGEDLQEVKKKGEDVIKYFAEHFHYYSNGVRIPNVIVPEAIMNINVNSYVITPFFFR